VILWKVFLPYFISFSIFFAYASFVFSGKDRDKDEKVDDANLALAIINIVYSIYALFREIKQVYA